MENEEPLKEEGYSSGLSDELYKREQKKGLLDDWNDKPEVKNKKIKAIDTEEEKAVKKGKYNALIVFSFLGVISFLVLSGVAVYWAYVGGFSEPVSLFCGSTNVTIPDCPSIPSCPQCPERSCPTCSLTCPAITIKNYINQSD